MAVCGFDCEVEDTELKYEIPSTEDMEKSWQIWKDLAMKTKEQLL